MSCHFVPAQSWRRLLPVFALCALLVVITGLSAPAWARQADTTRPSVVITGPEGEVFGDFDVTITFSEDVEGFTTHDIKLNSAYSASDFRVISASVYEATFTPRGDGRQDVVVRDRAAYDAAGNFSTRSNILSVNYDTSPTTAFIEPGVLQVPRDFTVDVYFSRDITGFEESDLALTNASARGIETFSPRYFRVSLRAAANGEVTIQIPAGAATDSQNRESTASNVATVTADVDPPSVTLSASESLVNDSFVVTLTFSEDVQELTTSDLSVQNGYALSSNLGGCCAQVFNVSIEPTSDGIVTVDLPAGAAEDRLGNPSLAAAAPVSVTFDGTGPTATISGPAGPVNGPFSATFTFSEDVTGFELSDIDTTYAVASGLQAVSAREFTATITPISNGNLRFHIDPGSVQDAAGNTNPQSETFSIENDIVPPAPSRLARNDPHSAETNSDTLTWGLSFTEAVTGASPSNFDLIGSTASLNVTQPEPNNVHVTASGGDLASLEGEVYLNFRQPDGITDIAGNGLVGAPNTHQIERIYYVDNTPPTAAITSLAGDPVIGPFIVDISFSEFIEDFQLSDLTIENATASLWINNESGGQWTATVTPQAFGSVRLTVNADTSTDRAGNANLASDVFSVEYVDGRELTLGFAGLGSGRISSDFSDLVCAAACMRGIPLSTAITLTAEAADGSSFASWTDGPCAGSTTRTCVFTISEDISVEARFTQDSPPDGRIVAATLPGARSSYVGGPVMTVFMTVVSRATTPAQSCRITAPPLAPFTLSYQELNGSTPVGNPNDVFDLANGGAQSFVLAMSPVVQTGASGYVFYPQINCENATLAPIEGVSSVQLSIGSAPVPDILSIGATPSGDGVVRIPATGNRIGLMAASAVNIGAGDGSLGVGQATVSASVDTGAVSLPVTLEVCESGPSGCVTPRGQTSVLSLFEQNVARTFTVFVRANGDETVAFSPANARVFLRFTDATGVIRSVTSAAISAPSAAGDSHPDASMAGRWSVLVRQGEGDWPSLRRASLYLQADGSGILDDGETVRVIAISDDRLTISGSAGWPVRLEGRDAIFAGDALEPQSGAFWGVRDERGASLVEGGQFGTISLTGSGEIRGNISGCAVFGEMPQSGIHQVWLSGCAYAGQYRAAMDAPVEPNGEAVLLIANELRGWRLPAR